MLRGGDEIGIWLNKFSDIVLYVLARYPRANIALDECKVELFAAGASSALACVRRKTSLKYLQDVVAGWCLLPSCIAAGSLHQNRLFVL